MTGKYWLLLNLCCSLKSNGSGANVFFPIQSVHLIKEVYSEPCQAYNMEHFAKIVK